MPIETEHKYLVTDDSYRQMALSATEIIQGYLTRNKERTVRVRLAGERAFITVKGAGDGASRPEYEYEIPRTDGQELMRLCLPGALHKTRHIVVYEGFRWEVDEYHGALQGLVTAELELPDRQQTYPLPPFVGRNVTGDPQYSNALLSEQCV